MADQSLTEALSGLNMRGIDTPWGIGAYTLGQNAGAMINPYGSWGSNLAIGLGTTLATALLGYQAKQSALEQNLALQPGVTAALKATSMDQLDNIMAQPEYQRLGSIGTELKTSLLARQAAAAEKANEFRQALQIAGLKEGYMPAGMEGLFGAPAAADGITPMQARDLAQAKRKMELEETIKKPEREADRKLQVDKELQTIRNTLASDPITKMFQESRVNFETAQQLATEDSKTATLALKKIGERAINPGNQVTLQELQGYGEIMPILDKYRYWFESKTKGLSDLSPEARAEIVGVIGKVVDNLGNAYNNRVENSYYGAKQAGWTDDVKRIAPVDLWTPGKKAGITTSPVTPKLPINGTAPVTPNPFSREQLLAEKTKRLAVQGE